VLVVGFGCGPPNEIFIRQIQKVDVSSGCGVTDDPGAPALFSGHWDATRALTYQADLLVGNRSGADVQLQSVSIEILSDAGSVLGTNVETVSGFVEAPEGEAPSYGLTHLALFHERSAVNIHEYLFSDPLKIVARITVTGTTLDGEAVESEPWSFPLTVCNQYPCLYCSCPNDIEQAPVVPCYYGQEDQGYDCRLSPNFADYDCT